MKEKTKIQIFWGTLIEIHTGLKQLKIQSESMSTKFLQLVTILALVASINAIVCSTNQYYTADGSCGKCPQNCATCSNAQFCTSCLNNFYLVNNNFNVTCQGCSQIFTGCKTCLSNVACTECGDGFFVGNGICNHCSTKNLFCARCSTDGNTCTLCTFPFILSNNICISATISSVTDVTTTTTSSTNSSTANTTTQTLITLSNGTQVPVVLDANGCNQLQIFYNQRCIKRIDNCNLYQGNGLCQYCDPNFLVTIYGDCTPKNRFLRCEPGFWLNKATDSCEKVSPACDWYYPNNGSCLNCSSGYKWNNNSCTPNIVCNARQFFYAGTCIDVPPQCSTFNNVDGACTSCTIGYTLQSGLCILTQNVLKRSNLCTFPCKTCLGWDRGYCFSCEIYYELKGGSYGKCSPVLY